MTDHWTIAEYKHYEKTGQTPEQAQAAERTVKRVQATAERYLQDQCENWLHHRGYKRLTADNAIEARDLSNSDFRGWYGHLVKAKRNPLMPDIFIFSADMSRSLHVELKARNEWQPGQREMVDAGRWRVAWTFREFEVIVVAWENELNEKGRGK